MRSANKPIIKVVSGIRRCGKSSLLEMFKEHLLSTGVTGEQIVSVNFEELDYEYLCDYKLLYAYVKERLVTGKTTYIFLDEIQHVKDFEKAVDSLFIKKNVDLYITGSNAYFMSGELATLLSGRYIELQMLPFSFKEYCSATLDKPIQEKYNDYITRGSFPYSTVHAHTEKDAVEYLRGLYNTILVKDIATRYAIGDLTMLESVIRFIFANVGSRLSPANIANAMTSNGRQINNKTVEKYLNALVKSLMVYEAKRYNVKGKAILKLQEKYYIADMGLRFMLLGGKNLDVGHILENVVYLELLRRGYEVYVGEVGANELDFVAVSESGSLYIQVAASVRAPETLKRELTSLQKISDNYPKLILTLDDDPDADYDGIIRTNVLKWLLASS